MANLSSWQKISRVISGHPFGDGKDGAYSSATIPTLVYKTCSGSATSTTLTADTDASPFAVGDVLLLYQVRGTGAGQWEINRVSSVGSDTYTMQQALHYTYTDSGASQAQAVKVPRYTNVTVQSGTWTITDWDGNVGGILAFASNGALTVTGTITGVSKGAVGGTGGNESVGRTGYEGEGTSGASDTQSTSANGSGGGGGGPTDDGGSHSGAGGGGGGNGVAGSNGTAGSFIGTPGTGGSLVSSADLVTFDIGGAGGGGGGESTYTGGTGGDGGGGIFIFAKNIASVNSITLNGGVGGNGGASCGAGGGGSGGSCVVVCQTATLGTAKITATAGAGGTTGSYGGVGGAGGAGTIAIHHSGTITGTTSPTFTNVTDNTLVESNPGILMNFI